MANPRVQIESWSTGHNRWQELWSYICEHEPFPAEFVDNEATNSYFASIALAPDDKLIGYHLLRVQPIGPEMDMPEIKDQNDNVLQEAKVRALRVDESWRNQGIGTRLQEATLAKAAELGCFQMRSRSSLDRVENYAIKIKLGFACHPANRTFKDGTVEAGVYWVKRMNQDEA
ncbi:MAG: GNAT family N-acetyltransferase [Anaerolineae bacterium]